jgi:SAM-dependent methyltransferase
MIELPPIFFEIHSENPREGPGDYFATRRAWQAAGALQSGRILDFGCGPGMPTRALARLTRAHITAADMHRPFLLDQRRLAKTARLDEYIAPLQASMDAPPFALQTFDLIWSEGAIFIVGLEEGLRLWRRWLKPGGYAAITDASWLKPDPPEELVTFWQAYPGMTTVEANLESALRAGYRVLDHFTLPESAWWEYYKPLQARISMLRVKYAGDAAMLEMLDGEEYEVDMYRRYSAWYGYEFFILQRTD